MITTSFLKIVKIISVKLFFLHNSCHKKRKKYDDKNYNKKTIRNGTQSR